MNFYLANLLGALSLTVTDIVQDAVEGAAGQGGHVAEALVLIKLRPGCSIRALAARLRLSHAGAVRLVDRLAALGWAERTPGRDRRMIRLHLTSAGNDKLTQVLAQRGDRLAAAVAALSAEQQAALTPIAQALLRDLTRDLVAAYANCRLCDVPTCEAQGCPVDAEARARFSPTNPESIDAEPLQDHTSAPPAVERLISDLFALGGVGYVALGAGTDLVLREAPGLVSQTTPESNFFEELLVNPTLLKLAGQRGDLNCGGLDHIAVGYGDFTMVLLRTAHGHLALGVGRKTPVRDLAARARQVLEVHGCSYVARQAGLHVVGLGAVGP